VAFNVIDEFTRECLAVEVDRSIDADGVVAVLDRLALERGCPPACVRMDSGPELAGYAIADGCCFTGTDSVFIDPRLAMAERWDRVVQPPPPRRAGEPGAVRLAARSPRDHRGLARRLRTRAGRGDHPPVVGVSRV